MTDPPAKGLRIAIPTKGFDGIKDTVSSVFARSKTLTIVDLIEDKPEIVEIIENKASDLRHGAGPIVVKTLKDNGVKLIVSGELGPGASTLLETICIYSKLVDPGIRVSKALEVARAELHSLYSQESE